MRDLNLSDLHNPDLFQEFCEQLLSLEYHDFRAIDDTRGDKGCDGLAQNDELWFQFYYPEQRGAYEERMKKIQRKITTDLGRLNPPYPKQWILVTVDKVSFDVHKHCRIKEKELKGVRIFIWSEPRLKTLIDKYHDLKDRWIQRIYGEAVQVIQPEAITYSQRNNIPALLEIDKQIGLSLSNWKYGDILKQVHTIDSTGKAAVAIVPKDNSVNVPVSLNIRMRFENNEEGNRKYNEFVDSQKHGKEFELDGKFIEAASLKINNQSIEGFFSPIDKQAVLKLRPVPRPPINAYIDLFGKNKIRLQRIPNLKIKITSIDNTTAQLDNYSQESEKIRVKTLINTATQQGDFTLSIDEKYMDAVDGFRCATVLYNFVRSSKIKLFLDNPIKPIEFNNTKALSNQIENTYNYSKMLQDIQDAVGDTIPSLFSVKAENKDMEMIETVHEIIKKGKLIHNGGSFSFTVSETAAKHVQILLGEKGVSFKLTSEPIEVALQGKNIQLGYKITYFNGIIENESKELLNKAIAKCNIEGTKVRFKSLENDLPIVELYPYWIKNAEKKIKEFEESRAKGAMN
jgi:hypothetical protein